MRTRWILLAGACLCVLAALLLGVFRSGRDAAEPGSPAGGALVAARTGGEGSVLAARESTTQPPVPRDDGPSTPDEQEIREANARIVQQIKDAEFSRLLSIQESEDDHELRYELEIESPSPEELARLRKLAYATEGTVEESGFVFPDAPERDKPLADYLVESFFLQPGNENAKITLTFRKNEPDRVSHSCSVKLKGTETTSVRAASEPFTPGWRYDLFVEASYDRGDGSDDSDQE